MLGLLDRIVTRGAKDSTPLSEEQVRAELISIYPELSSALYSSDMPPKKAVKDTGTAVTTWFNRLAEYNRGKEGQSNWHALWDNMRVNEGFWREVAQNLRSMRYPDFLNLYIGGNGLPSGMTNPTKAVMDDGLAEIINVFEEQHGDKDKRDEESGGGGGKKRRPLGEGGPEVGQRPVAPRTGESVGMSGVTAMHANADSMAQQGDMKPEADRPPGVSGVAMPADGRPVDVTDAPIQVTPEMPAQQEGGAPAAPKAPRQIFASWDAFHAFIRKQMDEGKLGENSVQVEKELLKNAGQMENELPAVKEAFALLVYQCSYFPEIMSTTQAAAFLDKQPGAPTASMSQKVDVLSAIIDGHPGSPFGPALIPNVKRAFVELRETLMELMARRSARRGTTVEEVGDRPAGSTSTKRKEAASAPDAEVPVRQLKFQETLPGAPPEPPTEPLLTPIEDNAADAAKYLKKNKPAPEKPAAPRATRSRGKKDGMDIGKKKKKAAAPKTKPDTTSAPHMLATEIQSEIVSNPEREKPTNSAVERSVKAVMTTDYPNLKWDTLTGNKQGKRNYLRLSGGVRRLITGQSKKPHEYAMLGHHWSENKEGEVHRNCHRLEEYRKPGHPVGGIHMAVLPKTPAEARQAQIATLFGHGGDHRLFSEGQRAAYAKVKQREYNDWPLSTSNVPGKASITDREKTANEQEAYRARYGRDWQSFQQRVALGMRPDLYKEPRGSGPVSMQV